MTKYCTRLLTAVLIISAASRLSAQNGIRFEHDMLLADALKKAQTEGKLVFMDAYTTWCGPCKMMASKVFPDSSAGAFFNQHFVNLKVDMEKGEGTSLALKYNVEYFPTLLFINAEGQVVHKAVGFHTAPEFVSLATIAINPAANLLALETRYGKGERNADLLRLLTEARGAAYDPSTGQLANEYLKTQRNLSSPANMDIIMRYVDDPFSDGFKSLQKNRASYEQKYSAREVQQKVDGVFEGYLQSHPKLQLGEVQRLYGTVYPEQGERLASNYRLSYYREREDMKNFGLAAVDHYTRFPCTDADELNEMAYLFAQNITDPAMLQKAVEWSQKSISIKESSLNQDTLARLYLLLGKKKQAATAARRSIELAQTAGEDASQTKLLLEKINGK